MASAKTAIVTGAGTGIGKASALALAADGWNVVLTGRRHDVLDKATSEAKGGKTIAIACDVTDEEQVDRLFAQTVEQFGRVDLLFNNAGAGLPGKPIDEIAVADWRRVVEVNLTGSFLCARAAFGQMRKQNPQGGRIVNNGSISAYAPRPGSVAYTATKHAITGLTRTLALDGRPFGIACGQIDIGNAATEMTAAMSKGVPQANGTLAVEPTMNVQHVADAVLHMANLPADANILFMTVMATNMPFVGRG
jgi:NAD(P)-dependent dehydrogenase (short-subunit alcohol dehydrogenase family)